MCAAGVLALLCACSSPSRPAAREAPAASASPAVRPASARPAPAPYLVVTRERSKSVRTIPLDGSPASDLAVGADTLGAASDGTTAALTAESAGELVLVSGRPPTVATIGGLGQPHDAAFTRDGQVAVTEQTRRDVAIVDVATRTVVRRIAMPGRPHNIVPGGPAGLIVTLPDAKSIALVDPSGSRVRTIDVGERPHACAAVADSIWCVTYDKPHVLRITADAVAHRITLGTYPHHIVGDSGGGVIVSDPVGGSVYRLDAAGRVVSRYPMVRPAEVLTQDGAVYVASDKDVVVELRAGDAVGRWDVPGFPHAVALAR